MSETPGLVVNMRAVRTDAWDRREIKSIDGRYRCLCRFRGSLMPLILCTTRMSPSRHYIEIGGFFGGFSSWVEVAEIEVVEVLEKMKIEEPTPVKPRPWWKRWLGLKP